MSIFSGHRRSYLLHLNLQAEKIFLFAFSGEILPDRILIQHNLVLRGIHYVRTEKFWKN